jgi:hypothetical protein
MYEQIGAAFQRGHHRARNRGFEPSLVKNKPRATNSLIDGFHSFGIWLTRLRIPQLVLRQPLNQVSDGMADSLIERPRHTNIDASTPNPDR